MPDIPFREIIREPEFEEELRALIGDAEEADEFVAAAEYLLASEPESGTRESEVVWVLPMSPIGHAAIWLFYTFDAQRVTFLSIRPFRE